MGATVSIGKILTIGKRGLLVVVGNACLSGSTVWIASGFRSFPSRLGNEARPIGDMFRGVPSTFDSPIIVRPRADGGRGIAGPRACAVANVLA